MCFHAHIRVAWEGVTRPSLRAPLEPVCSVHTGCRNCFVPLLRISGAFVIAKGLPCSVEQLCGCGGLGDCQLCLLRLVTTQTLLSLLEASLLERASCVLPCISPRAVHNYKTTWLLSLLPLLWGATPCVSYHLTHLWLTFRLGFKRLLTTSQEQSSWRPF